MFEWYRVFNIAVESSCITSKESEKARQEKLMTSFSQDLAMQTINQVINELDIPSGERVDDVSLSTKSFSNGIKFLT